MASGLNGGGRMASAKEVFDYGGAPEEEDGFSAVDEGTKERIDALDNSI